MKKKFSLLPDIAGLLCLMIFGTMIALNGESALEDADTLWHIKAGEVMIKSREILTRDIFSHTADSKEWTSHEWLSEIIMAALYKTTGFPGLVTFFFLIVSLTFWILYKILEEDYGLWPALICSITAFIFAKTHLLARPHIFSWLFGIISFAILIRGGKKLYLLPALMIPWSNMHGGFIIGLVLQGIFLAGSIAQKVEETSFSKTWENKKNFYSPALVLALSILTTCINPFGYKLLFFPFKVSAPVFLSNIQEWRSVDFQKFRVFRIFVLTLILLLVSGKRRVPWTHNFLLVVFLNAALIFVRNISIAGMYLAPVFAAAIQSTGESLKRFLTRKPTAPNDPGLHLSLTSGPITVAVICAILLISSYLNGPLSELLKDRIKLPEKFSSNVVSFLESHNPKGKLFNEYSMGGLIIHEFGPKIKVFIDGRADMYGETIMEDYLKIVKLDNDVDELLESYRINWVLFSESTALVRYLKVTGDWKEIYNDNRFSVLTRTNLLSDSLSPIVALQKGLIEP